MREKLMMNRKCCELSNLLLVELELEPRLDATRYILLFITSCTINLITFEG